MTDTSDPDRMTAQQVDSLLCGIWDIDPDRDQEASEPVFREVYLWEPDGTLSPATLAVSPGVTRQSMDGETP